MAFTTLVGVRELARHLGDPNWVIFDCRFDLKDPEAGRRAYRAGHVAGARYAHLDEDLSGQTRPDTGRHPLPNPQILVSRLGEWGVGRASQVVAYDDGSGAIAARLWWLVRWLGHDDVAVLEGGIERWCSEGGTLTAEPPIVAPTAFSPSLRGEMAVNTPELAQRLMDGSCLLIDARDAKRFGGIEEPIDPVAGHIPGALNFPFGNNLATDGRFHSPVSLRQAYRTLLAGRTATEVVHMCGSGVTACHNILAMEHAGLSGAKLYPGSWSEWIRDPGRAIERAARTHD